MSRTKYDDEGVNCTLFCTVRISIPLLDITYICLLMKNILWWWFSEGESKTLSQLISDRTDTVRCNYLSLPCLWYLLLAQNMGPGVESNDTKHLCYGCNEYIPRMYNKLMPSNQRNFNQITVISFSKMNVEILSVKWQPFSRYQCMKRTKITQMSPYCQPMEALRGHVKFLKTVCVSPN